ncbi:MAG: hypothetical protein JWM68_555 [Verrucomicrobiales bacterium]|nr:hypothetical protein [Verrucomicrobiales bacterium]
MKEVLFFIRVSFCVVACFVAQNIFASNADPAVSAAEIIQKAVTRAKVAETEVKPEYALVQTTTTEERDSQGQVKDRNQKAEEVRFSCGRMVKAGEPAEKKRDSAKLSLKNSSRSDFINLLTPELIGKYIFSFVTRTNVNGRDAFELSFRPCSKNLPGKELTDKIMNQAKGRLWIDAEEFELVRAQVRVDSEVPVAGFLGALKRAAFSMERVRLETGLWLERFYKTDYESRKLLECKRVITESEFSNFRRVNRG